MSDPKMPEQPRKVSAAPPFAVFDEFGKGCDDKVADHVRAYAEALAAARVAPWKDHVSQAQRERNDAANVRDAALSALFEVERLAGHDDALTDWREKWSYLWTLRVGPSTQPPETGKEK